MAGINWRWPHGGTVIAGYSTSGKVNKGIDIAGQAGDAVRAAASGNVVYAGNGLLGYGNLIIVNHNEHYLSAYAHNRKILVQEGEDVTAGQVIAELGSSGAERPMLHFEIRKNGNPVDPLHYLPPADPPGSRERSNQSKNNNDHRPGTMFRHSPGKARWQD